MAEVLDFVARGRDQGAVDTINRIRQAYLELAKAQQQGGGLQAHAKQIQSMAKEMTGLSRVVSGLPQQTKYINDYSKQWREMRSQVGDVTNVLTRDLIPGLGGVNIATIGASAAIGLFLNKLKEGIDKSRSFLELSRQTGFAREQLDRLNAAGARFNLTAADITQGVRDFTKEMVDMNRESGGGAMWEGMMKVGGPEGMRTVTQLKAIERGTGDVTEKRRREIQVTLEYVRGLTQVKGATEALVRGQLAQQGIPEFFANLARADPKELEEWLDALDKVRGALPDTEKLDAYNKSVVELNTSLEGTSRALTRGFLDSMTNFNTSLASLLNKINTPISAGNPILQFIESLDRALVTAIAGAETANRLYGKPPPMPAKPESGGALFTGQERSGMERFMIPTATPGGPFDFPAKRGPSAFELFSGPQLQGGALDTLGGPAQLHPHEMVLPKEVADTVRNAVGGGLGDLGKRYEAEEGKRKLEENTRELHDLNTKLQRMIDGKMDTLATGGAGGGGGGGAGAGGPGAGTGLAGTPSGEAGRGPGTAPGAGPETPPIATTGPAAGSWGRFNKPPEDSTKPPEGSPKPSAAGGVPPELSDWVALKENFTPNAFSDFGQTNIGYGTSARGRTSITEPEARAEMNAELAKHLAAVDQLNPNLPAGERMALASLAYNTGGSWLSKSREKDSALREAVKSGNLEEARRIFLTYTHAGKKELPGLVTRRKQEARMFDDPKFAKQGTSAAQDWGGKQDPRAMPSPAPAARAYSGGGLGQLGASAASPPEHVQKALDALGKANPVQKFAEGGVVTKPTLGLLGEMGPEAVVPLNKFQPTPIQPPSGKLGAVTNIRGTPAPDRQVAAELLSGKQTFGSMQEMREHAAALVEAHIGEYRANPQQATLLRQFMKTGGEGMNAIDEAWCAHTVNAAMRLSGIKGSGSAAASSFNAWERGISPQQAQRGDVVTLPAIPGVRTGHVGIVTGPAGPNSLPYVSGNTGGQSHVGQANLPFTGGSNRVLQVRRAVEHIKLAKVKPGPEMSEAVANVPSHASGAWNVLGGLANLHRGEMVLPRGVADILRQGQGMLGQMGGIGGLLKGGLGGLLGGGGGGGLGGLLSRIPQLGQLSGMAEQAIHKIEGSASLDVNVNAPHGTNVRASAEGLFKQVLLNRRLTMPYADEHGAHEQLGR